MAQSRTACGNSANLLVHCLIFYWCRATTPRTPISQPPPSSTEFANAQLMHGTRHSIDGTPIAQCTRFYWLYIYPFCDFESENEVSDAWFKWQCTFSCAFTGVRNTKINNGNGMHLKMQSENVCIPFGRSPHHTSPANATPAHTHFRQYVFRCVCLLGLHFDFIIALWPSEKNNLYIYFNACDN